MAFVGRGRYLRLARLPKMPHKCSMAFVGHGRYLRLARQGVMATERCFEVKQKDGSIGRIVLMPMVHLAAQDFFTSTLRSPEFGRFDLAFIEGHFCCTREPAWPKWRFIDSPLSACPLALLLEACWMEFFRIPLAFSNACCQHVCWEPLRFQPQALCDEKARQHFVWRGWCNSRCNDFFRPKRPQGRQALDKFAGAYSPS